jgi:hypothetical protein
MDKKKKVAAESLTILFCIREVPGSNLGLDTRYPDRVFVVFSLRPGKLIVSGIIS